MTQELSNLSRLDIPDASYDRAAVPARGHESLNQAAAVWETAAPCRVPAGRRGHPRCGNLFQADPRLHRAAPKRAPHVAEGGGVP